MTELNQIILDVLCLSDGISLHAPLWELYYKFNLFFKLLKYG